MKLEEDIVTLTGDTLYACTSRVRQHSIIADEPVLAGGMDKGPNPHELVLSALGSCSAITLRMYANRKGWDLKTVEVFLNYDKLENHKISIQRKLRLNGGLDAEQKQRLLEIAVKCPVARVLEGENTITTILID